MQGVQFIYEAAVDYGSETRIYYGFTAKTLKDRYNDHMRSL